MALTEFLSNLSWGGQNLGQLPAGGVAMNTGKLGQFNSPLAFAAALQEAGKPGNLLSDLGTDKVFSGQVEGIVGQQQQAQKQQQAAMQQAGINPAFASQQTSMMPYQAVQQVSQLRGGIEQQKQENTFNAQQAFVQALAAVEANKQSFDMSNYWAKKQYKLAKKGQELSTLFNAVGLGMMFLPGIGPLGKMGSAAAGGKLAQSAGKAISAAGAGMQQGQMPFNGAMPNPQYWSGMGMQAMGGAAQMQGFNQLYGGFTPAKPSYYQFQPIPI